MKIRVEPLTTIALSIISLACAGFLAFQDLPSMYSLLPLIPLAYFILNLIYSSLCTRESMSNICIVIFDGVMFLRCVIMPLLLTLGGYACSKTVNCNLNMPKAILLFIYEITIEYTVLFVLSIIREEKTKDDYLLHDYEVNYNYWRVVLILLIGLIVFLLMCPKALGYYRTIFGITDIDYTAFDSRELINTYATGFLSKLGLITFRYFANVSRIVFPAIIIIKMKNKGKSAKFAGLVTMIIIFIFDFLIVDDTIATSVINALITFLFYNRLFSQPRKIIKYLLIAFIAVVAYFILRISLTTSGVRVGVPQYILRRLSNYAQAYFCGINNIAGGFNLHTEGFMESIKYMTYEVLKGIPYANTIFHLDSTNISNLYNSVNNCSGQIVPVVSSCSLYFSPILAPLYGSLLILFGFKASVGVIESQKPLCILAYISMCVYAVMGSSMYSVEAICAFICTIGLPILLLSRMFEKNERKEEID